MKNIALILIPSIFAAVAYAEETAPPAYVNFIRQIQASNGRDWAQSANLAVRGTVQSQEAVQVGGSTFQLWTVRDSPRRDFLLDHTFVGSAIATVTIRTGDVNAPVPRTRAGEPFWVDVEVKGLQEGPNVSEAMKKLSFLHKVQSYGPAGDHTTVDRSQATTKEQFVLDANATFTFPFPFSTIPGSDSTNLRGEETFSAYSLADGSTPAFQIHSATLQIWPRTKGRIDGISDGQKIRYTFPEMNISFEDIYPGGSIYAQVYKGSQVDGTEGTQIPGAVWVPNSLVPESGQLPVKLDDFVNEDGLWTLELVTTSPFDQIVLGSVTFNVNRTIKVNGSITTIE